MLGINSGRQEVWTTHGAWNGPSAVLYRSFDTLTGIKLMSESRQIDYDAFVPGKVNHASRLTIKLISNLLTIHAFVFIFPDQQGSGDPSRTEAVG